MKQICYVSCSWFTVLTIKYDRLVQIINLNCFDSHMMELGTAIRFLKLNTLHKDQLTPETVLIQ